jgi:hypothetical protein
MPPAEVFLDGGESELFATPNTAAPFFASGHGAIIINNGKLFQ